MKQKLLTLCTLTLLLALSDLSLPAQTLAVGSTLLSAKNNPYLVPPTPEAAAFLNYGQYSVSQASGQVDVSIPIYEIRTRELAFPVSLSYIGGGVKVTDKASWAGLGWVLNAGGVVNLTINGLPDKGMNPELPTATKIRADKDAASLNLTVAEKSNGLNDTDRMRDRYDYTMGKTGGSFYIAGYNNYLQVPYTENHIRRLVNSTGKLTAGFVITDDSGTSYHYEQAEKSTVISTVYNHKTGVMSPLCESCTYDSAWYLTKIVSMNKTDSINFVYARRQDSYIDRTLSHSYEIRHTGGTAEQPEREASSIIHTRTVNSTPVLKEIRFPQGRLVFTTAESNADGRKFRLSGIALYDKSGKKMRSVEFAHGTFAGGRLKLETVTFKGATETVYDSYDFKYYNEDVSVSDLAAKSSLGYLAMCSPNCYYAQDLQGYYNGKSNPSLLGYLPVGDKYYDTYIADRSHSASAAKIHSLKSIEGITGAYTELVYDTEDYAVPRTPAIKVRQVISKDLATGRTITRNYDYSNPQNFNIPFDPSLFEDYSVTQVRNMNAGQAGPYEITQSWTCSSEPLVPGWHYSSRIAYRRIVEKIIDSSSPSDTLKTVYGFDIKEPEFVSTEQFQERYYNSQREAYAQWKEKLSEAMGSGLYTSVQRIGGFSDSRYEIPGYVVDNSWANGNLSSVDEYEWKAGEYVLKRSIKNTYKEYGRKNRESIGIYCKGILPRFLGLEYEGGDFLYYYCKSVFNFYFFDICISTGWKKLVSRVTTEYDGDVPKVTTESFGYNAIEREIRPHSLCTYHDRAVKNGLQLWRDVSFRRYLYDSSLLPSNVIDTMATRNYISAVIEDQHTRLTGVSGPTIKKNHHFVLDGDNVCEKKTEAFCTNSNSPEWKRSFEVLLFNSNAQPLSAVDEDGVPYVYLWGSDDRYPILVVRNAQYSQVENETDNGYSFDELPALLPNAQIWRYEYAPLLGLTGKVAPDGGRTGYDYDDCGRLTREKVMTGAKWQTLKEYDYTLGYSGSVTRNSIETNTRFDDQLYIKTREFFNAFGHPVQSMVFQAGTSGKNIVSDIVPDALGRIIRRSLPTPVNSDGNYYPGLLPYTRGYYNDFAPNTEYAYEKSSSGRLIEERGPGQMWRNDRKFRTRKYSLNDTTSSRSCKLLQLVYATNLDNDQFSSSGLYPNGYLNIRESVDEDGITIFTFVNPAGQSVLERRFLGSTRLDTHYIYDNYGNLRIILPPMASSALNSVTTAEEKQALMDKYAFIYGYDPLNRPVRVKEPGKEWEYRRYDKAGHCIFVQDGKLREVGKWKFEIPDRQGRQVMTGLCKNTDVESIRSVFVYASPTGSTTGYTGYGISNLTLTEPEYLTINYYDSYDYRSLVHFADSLPVVPTTSDSLFTQVYTNIVEGKDISVIGQLTGKLVREVSGEGWTFSSYWYDELNRPVRTASHNTSTGIADEVFTNYNISGKPVLKKRIHLRGADTVFTEMQEFRYDRMGQHVETLHGMNEKEMKPMLRNVYDDVGRLVKVVYGESLDSLTYSYNIRNLPTSISGTDFCQNLYYNISPGTRRHNGFVSAVSWKVGNHQWQGYKYGYDSAGHLIVASYAEGSALTDNIGRYDESFTSYDLNGNLLGLRRTGQTGVNSFARVDDLTLEYDGNHLVKVSDAVATMHPNVAYNRFNGGSRTEVQYEYDACGNLVYDDNRRLSLSYNHLSLPDTLSFENGGRLLYGWDAEGRKLSLTIEEPGKEDVRKDYLDGVIYRDGVPEMLQTATGYYSFKDGKYRHFIRDYLGSVRLVRNEDGAVEEINSYYPSGALLSAPVPDTQPHKYSGKERINELGLGWYDFGARHYDPVLMRWHSSDVWAEKAANVSPYAFCLNNPVNFVDSDGKFPEIIWDLFSIGIGVKSFADNVKAGNVWGAVFDAGGIVVDVVAAAVPFVPGGVGAVRAGIKAAKAADTVDDVVDAARAADKALDAAKTADRVDNATDVAKGMKHRGPDANDGVAKPHGNADHNKAIDDKIVELEKSDKVEYIRKNQVQVDFEGNKVGNNRPDVQWNADGVHHNYEVDRTRKNSDRHKKVIEANDPKAAFEYELIIDGLVLFDKTIK